MFVITELIDVELKYAIPKPIPIHTGVYVETNVSFMQGMCTQNLKKCISYTSTVGYRRPSSRFKVFSESCKLMFG